MIARILAVLLTALSLSACGLSLDPPPPTVDLGTNHVLDKNYTLTKTAVAYVGENIVAVKDYYTQSTAILGMRPAIDFRYGGRDFSRSHIYRIIGKYTRDTGTFNVVESDAPSLHLLVSDDGVIQPNYIVMIPDGRRLVPFPTTNPEPLTARMQRVTETKTLTAKGFVNYQIIYNGTDGKSFFLTYREFTPEDMAKTAFYQNLTYSTASKAIRFRNLLIDVRGADNEKITYAVMTD